MKVIALVGSARKKHTYHSASLLLDMLKEKGVEETEILRLSDYDLGICHGCKNCTDKSETLCPLNDDRDLILKEMEAADGIIWAVPNYSFHVSALTKQFLDRLAFVFHRPSYFGKTSTAIVSQGIYGGGKILKYLNFISNAMGCHTVKGCCLTTLEPMTEKTERDNKRKIRKLSHRLMKRLEGEKFPKPKLMDQIIFRVSRSKIRSMLNEDFGDYQYYKKKGWFESDYFYPVKFNLLERVTGNIVDGIASGK